MAKPQFLSDAGFSAACLSYSPPKVLGGGYALLSLAKARELGLVRTRIDRGKYPAKNLVTVPDKIKQVLEILS